MFLGGQLRHGLAQRVLAARLNGGAPGQQVAPADVVRRQRDQLRFAFGQRAGFVESHQRDAVRHLQRVGVLDQNAMPRRHAGARHDGGGRGQPQRAGAGNHQHRHRVENGDFPITSRQAPAQQREQRNAQHHRHKHSADLVYQPLNRRFFGLGRFHHAHHARQRGLGPQRGGAHQQQAFAIDGAAGHVVAHFLVHRQAFTGDQRRIHLGAAFGDLTIHCNAFAGPHHHDVAGAQRSQGHFGVLAVQPAARHLGAQRVQRPNGVQRLVFGARFHPLAQQHQRDDHAGSLKVQVRRSVRALRQQQINRQPIRG